MSPTRVFVYSLLLSSAVACGGSAKFGSETGGANAGGNSNVAGRYNDAGAGTGSIASGPSYAGAYPRESGGAPSGGAPNGGGGGLNDAAGGPGMKSCTAGNITYPSGSSWACDCNTCSCQDGSFWSTAIACVSCEYGGNSYSFGQTFPAVDGCNSCSCGRFGQVDCTENACACDPTQEWSKHYLVTDPKLCATVDYVCPANTTTFQNSCGCGCQQGPACPRWIDCSPGPEATSCETQKQNCPYSDIAL